MRGDPILEARHRRQKCSETSRIKRESKSMPLDSWTFRADITAVLLDSHMSFVASVLAKVPEHDRMRLPHVFDILRQMKESQIQMGICI